MFHDNDAHFINGITLNVRDLRTLQPFYEELLGFKKVEETLTAVKYQIGDRHHYITLREIKSGRNPLSQEAGLFYIGVQLSNTHHLADLIEKLNDYELPINGGEQNVCTFILSKIQKVICLSFMLINRFLIGNKKVNGLDSILSHSMFLHYYHMHQPSDGKVYLMIVKLGILV